MDTVKTRKPRKPVDMSDEARCRRALNRAFSFYRSAVGEASFRTERKAAHDEADPSVLYENINWAARETWRKLETSFRNISGKTAEDLFGWNAESELTSYTDNARIRMWGHENTKWGEEGVDWLPESEFRLSDIAETREHLFEDSYELERELSADLDAYFRTTDETDEAQPRYIGGGKDVPSEEEKPTEATGLTD